VNLNEQVNRIKSREEFVLFVQNLSDDLKERTEEWENPDLESYLDAIAAWTADMDGYYANRGHVLPEPIEWKILGEILMAAKYYE
jgi:hypothetical protein